MAGWRNLSQNSSVHVNSRTAVMMSDVLQSGVADSAKSNPPQTSPRWEGVPRPCRNL